MSESKLFVAIQDFSLNLDNGAKHLDVKVGEKMAFDGLYVECRGERGQARPLSKVIGEWIKPLTANMPQVSAKPSTLASTRNATGGRVIEDSDPSRDLGTRAQQEDSNAELKRLIAEYEKPQAPTHISERTTDDMADMRKESKVQVENQDALEVAQVSEKSKMTASKNTSGVEIEKQTQKKAAVISQEERVAKSTNYSKKKDASAEPKRLKVDKEAAGTEVRKVKTPAIQTNSVKTTTVESQTEVINDDVVVVETNYEQESGTVVGSSTQAKIVQDDVLTKSAAKQVPGVPKRPVVSDKVEDQDGQVVRKVSKIPEASMSTQEGITSKVTVGASGDMDVGDVVFEGNSEVSAGEVTFSKGEDTVQDVDGDIDIDGILGEV